MRDLLVSRTNPHVMFDGGDSYDDVHQRSVSPGVRDTVEMVPCLSIVRFAILNCNVSQQLLEHIDGELPLQLSALS